MLRAPASDRLIGHLVYAIHLAPGSSRPFHHLRLRGFFPPETYAAALEQMPGAASYRSMSGRSRQVRLADGVPTRTKLHLVPESVRNLSPAQREIWEPITTALRSDAVRLAFMSRLAAGLERRFGHEGKSLDMYPIPMLTRDVAGYNIGIHPDTRSKAITVQIYFPRDDSIRHVGTLFHRRLADGGYEQVDQVPFEPNCGYAFAVGADTYHSLDVVGPEVTTRDSILLTYFVDQTSLHKLRNRATRLGNLLKATLRGATPPRSS
jgi:hypothetical protein